MIKIQCGSGEGAQKAQQEAFSYRAMYVYPITMIYAADLPQFHDA